MPDWRDLILDEFTPQVASLTVVSDPDDLLIEEKISQEIQNRGFDLVNFEDPVKFRYYFESKYRSHWDTGESNLISVVLRTEITDLGELPFDLKECSRHLAFNLGEIFPSLSYPIVAELDISLLDALYKAQSTYKPGSLGDNDTKDFILRHVFEIAPEIIKQESDLLRFLIRYHTRPDILPQSIVERLITVLRNDQSFDEWPLEVIIPDKEAFFTFLQERWPVFLDSLSETGGLESSINGNYEIKGIELLPFDHYEIKPLVDELFLEGKLKPVKHENSNLLKDKWASFGLVLDPGHDIYQRATGLCDSLSKQIPSVDDRHDKWLDFSRKLAELVALSCEIQNDPADLLQRIATLQKQVNLTFNDWLIKSYSALSNLPPKPPVMLHHVAGALSMAAESYSRIALIVLDGLAYNQWIPIKSVLSEQDDQLKFQESAVFAWIPTITPVSRQAIFAGKPPYFYQKSISTTSKEESHWKRFWQDQGYRQSEICYSLKHGDNYDDDLKELVTNPNQKIIGLVVTKIDKIVHGNELGLSSLHTLAKQWTCKGFLINLLNDLLNEGFEVWITSDHGNTEATGIGNPREGSIADSKGQRVRIYPDENLRSEIRERFPDSIEWKSIGLPEGFYPLIAPLRKAFITDGDPIITHGGTSIEEVIVPLIKVERTKQ